MMKYDRTVFIHIGIHKTGSTSIQNSLEDNADLLRTYGYNYYHDGLFSLVGTRIEQKLARDPDIIEREKIKCYELIENTESNNLIISSEHLSGFFIDGYSEASHLAQVLHFIFGNYRVKIVVYLRRQDQFIESCYLHTIKNHYCGWTFADFCDVVDIHGFNWYKHLTQYAKYFGKDSIIVRPYETIQLQNGNAVQDFYQVLGIPSDAIQAITPRWANLSYSRSALELARICNSALNRKDGGLMRELLDRLQEMQQSGDYTYSLFDVMRELLDYNKKSIHRARVIRLMDMLHTINVSDQVDNHMSLASAMRSRFLHSSEEYDATRDSRRIRNILKASNKKQPFEDFELFSSAERLKLLNYYEESNSRVAQEFLSRGDGKLFLETISEDDSRSLQQQGLSTDELASIVMNIFLELDKEVSDIKSDIKKEVTAAKLDIKKEQPYTIAVIGEIERLAIKLFGKLRIKNFLYRLCRRGFKIIKRL